MASEKALYWTAVGLMAVCLGNHFISRYEGKCLASRSLAAVQQISAEARDLMAMALPRVQQLRLEELCPWQRLNAVHPPSDGTI